ncbi:MAG: D-glycero-beta-D-manno-heptose 1-phosphate adenylyltransferase [Calditrichaceae bacterium]
MNLIVPSNEITELVQKLRKDKNCLIAFTNGCFDILHRGHVVYLEKAKEYASILIVGLNSDDSVRRLKGEGRPLMPEEDRAFILSRLESVDIVCVFDEDTPYELIKKILPDILVKGGDYRVEDIVGRDIVDESGGKVLTIPLVPGRSTTNIVNKANRHIKD